LLTLRKTSGVRFKLSHLLPGWLVLFTLGHFSHHLLTALPTPLLPFIRDEFALDYTRSGLILSVFSITYGLSQLPSGWLADRLGPRVLMTIGICGVAVSGIVIGLTPSYVLLLFGLGLMGILGGGYHPSAPPLVSSTVDIRKSGRALGVHAIGGSASFFLAPLVAAASAAVWGWRSAFLILAVPTLALGIFLYIKMAKFKYQRNFVNKADYAVSKAPTNTRNSLELYAFMILSSITTIIISTTSSFIPLFMVDHFGLSQKAAALIIAIIYFTGIFANPLAGLLSDRLGRVPVLATAGLALLPVLYFMNNVPNGWWIYLLLVLLGSIIAFTQTSSESYIVGHVPRERCSSTLGVYYFINMAGAGLLAPVLGALIDSRDFAFSFTLLGSIAAAASLLYMLWRWCQSQQQAQ
jgi:FSR family fosmidomycin resistance protein-like MFS transporter